MTAKSDMVCTNARSCSHAHPMVQWLLEDRVDLVLA